MLPNLTKIGLLIDFTVNQDFITEVFCINKEKPAVTCHGKCYLSQQLKKAEEQEEKQASTNKKERLEVIDYYSQSFFDLLSFANHYVSKFNPVCLEERHTSSFITDVFRPPKYHFIGYFLLGA